MSAALMNEMDRLRAERDEWKQQAEAEAIVSGSYRDERDAALEREQALAAIVKEMKQLAEDDVGFCEHLGRDLVELLTATDTRKAERRDLIKQAEALEGLPQGAWLTLEDAMECVDDFAREARQQAEALK